MNNLNPSDTIQSFFRTYERTTNEIDLNIISTQYADTFMFGGPKGVQSIKKEDFLNILPKRKGFFSTIGLKKTKLVSLEETKLDDRYIMVKVIWTMHYEKDGKDPIDNETSATYILLNQNNSLQIVFQIDHQDLMERIKELNL